MKLQIVKWGNGLALRIPAKVARSIHLRAGDRVEASLTVEGGLSIRSATWNRKIFSQELTAARNAMPMGKSAMNELRRGRRCY